VPIHGPSRPIVRLKGPALLRQVLGLSWEVSLWRLCEDAAARIAQLEADVDAAKRNRRPVHDSLKVV